MIKSKKAIFRAHKGLSIVSLPAKLDGQELYHLTKLKSKTQKHQTFQVA